MRWPLSIIERQRPTFSGRCASDLGRLSRPLAAVTFGLLVATDTWAAPFAYISNRAALGDVSVIDIATNTVVATIPTPGSPQGVAVHPNGARVYVTNNPGTNIFVIDTATNTVSTSITVAANPIGIAVNAAGTKGYVAHAGGTVVTVIDTTTDSVLTTIPVATGPAGVAVSPDGTKVYVTHFSGNTVSIISTASNTVTGSIAVGTAPQGVAFNPAGNRAYVANTTPDSVSVIDAVTDSVVATITGISTPYGVAVSPDGSRAYVSASIGDSLAVIDTATNTIVTSVPTGTAPRGVSVTPNGSRVYVANTTTNNVTVIDTAGNSVVATIPVGSGPYAFGAFIGGPIGPLTAPTISPPSFAFGNVPLTVPVNQTVTLTATSLITITSLATSDARFTATGSGATPCAASLTLSTGQTCTFALTFTPTGSGTYNNTTTIGYNNALGAPFTVTQNANGTGFPPPFTLSTPSIGFGNQVVGVPATQSFTFTNTSNTTGFPSTYTLTGFTTSGLGFTAAGSGATPCAVSLTLAAGASCGVTVTFTPTGTGSTNGTSTLNFLAGLGADPPYVAQVALNGNGVTGPVATITGSGTFPNTVEGAGSAVQAITLQNTGGANLTLSAISLTAPGIFVDTTGGPAPNAGHYCGFGSAADGSILTGAAKTLTPGQSCTINLIFTPKAQSNYNYSLAFTTDAAGSPHTVALSGTATAPTVTLGPALNFANQVEGTASAAQTVTLTNGSPVAITLTSAISVSSAGPFSVSPSGANPCTSGLVLAGGASCTASVVFAPTSTGSFGNGLTVSYQVITSLLNTGSSLGGNSLAPTFTLGPALNFGNVSVGSSSAAQTVTFTNTSPASLTVTVGPASGNPVFSATPSGANPCTVGTVIPPAGTCTFSSVYTPSGLANNNSSYSMTVQAVSTPLVASSTAGGTGVASVVNFSQTGMPAATVVPGLPIIVTFTLTGASGTPTGNVQISLRNLSTNAVSGFICTEAGAFNNQPLAGGVTTCHLTAPAAGNYNVEVVYAGDGSYAGSTGSFSLATAQLSPSSVLTPPLLAVVPAQPMTMSVTFSSTSPLGPPSGTIVVYLRNLSTNALANFICAEAGAFSNQPLTAGSATCTFNAPNAAGSYQIEIAYNGDAQHLAVTPTFNTIVNAQVLPVFSMTGLPPSANVGQQIVVTGSFTSASPLGPPSGNVVFNLRNFSTGGLSPAGCAEAGAFNSQPLTAGSSTCTFSVPATGNYKIEVPYPGDTQHLSLNGVSSTLTVGAAAAGPYVYIANQAGANVSVINPATNTVVATIPVGGTPRGVAVNVAGTRAYVANQGSGSLSVIDTTTNTVIASPAAGPGPSGIALNQAGTRAYVANVAAQSVTVLDTATNTQLGTVTVGTQPVGIAVSPTGAYVYVANNVSGTVSVIETAGLTVVATVTVGASPRGIAINPAGTRVYVANETSGTVSVIDTATNLVTATIPGTNPSFVAVNGAGTKLYVADGGSDNLLVIDTATNTQVGAVPVGVTAFGVAVNAAGTIAYVPNLSSNTVSVIDLSTLTVTATVPVGSGPASFGAFTQPAAVATTAPVITSGAPAAGTVGTAYNHVFAASGTGPIGWSLATGTLPAGLTLNPASGVLSGTPTAAGTFGFTIQAANGLAPNATQNVSITIAAVAVPAFSPSATTLTFGSQTVATTSAAQVLTITNTGGATMTISAPVVTGPFAVTVNTCTGLAPAGTCTVSVTFTPVAGGAATGTLSITTNATGSPHVISLTGTGAAAGTPTLTVGFAPASVATATNATMTLTLSNPNASPAIISIGGTVTVPGLTMSGLVDGCSASASIGTGFIDLGMAGSIPALGSCTIAVQVQSAVAGSFPVTINPGNLVTSFGNNANTSSATLTVIALVPVLTLAPTTLNFGTRTVNTTSPASVVTVTNTGTAAAFLSNIVNTGDFAFTTTCPLFSTPLNVGGTCNINVTFTPLTASALSGTITITSNATGSPQVISLSGTGAAVGVTNIAVNPASLDFGPVTVGTGSPPLGVVVSNTGFANLLLSGVTVAGPFARVAQAAVPPDCGASVAPGAACTLSLAFTPAVTGAATGQLSIAHNATGSPTVIPLTGLATSVPVPVLSVAPRIAFGDQVLGSPTSAALNLANVGSANLNIGTIALSGSSDFSIAGTCSVIVPAASCVVNVGFSPSALGARAGQIDITSNTGSTQAATTGTASVAVTGNGILAPRPVGEVSVTAIGFGNSIFGGASTAQIVTLKSVGSSPLEIRNIFTNGADFVQMNSCSNVLPTNASCAISVAFSPLSIGAKLGELQMLTNAAESPHRVALSGTGCRWFSQTASRFFLTSCGN